MARHKVTTTDFENPKKSKIKDAKSRMLIFRIFTYVYVALFILTLLITGANYHNNLIFGIGYVTMGVISIGSIAFVIYTEIKGWYRDYIYWKDYEHDPCLVESPTGKEELRKDLAEHRFVMIFIGLIYLGVAVYMLFLGICALLGIG